MKTHGFQLETHAYFLGVGVASTLSEVDLIQDGHTTAKMMVVDSDNLVREDERSHVDQDEVDNMGLVVTQSET